MIAVITPSHKPEMLKKAYESLISQTYSDWIWILLVSNHNDSNLDGFDDKRVIIKTDESIKSGNIGLIKKMAFDSGIIHGGDILVELDHDDWLTPDCLYEVNKAFAETGADFVYSNTFHIQDGKPIQPFGAYYGWEYGEDYVKAFPPSPSSFSYIWYAPNHVRAWKTDFYKRIGGHNSLLNVCDDYDLCARTYIHGKVHLIDKPLYYYLHHNQNTCYGEQNAKIQETTKQLHDKYIQSIVLKWCDLNGLPAVDLCCHNQKPERFIGVDIQKYDDVDIVADLNERWPFEDNSVGCFRAVDAIEHIKSPLHTMKELYRCLAPGGWALIEVPSTDGRGAFQDPTHVSFWNSNSFWYYTKADQARFIDTPVRFASNRILNYFPTQYHQDHNIVYTKAHLIKLDDKIKIAGGIDI